MDDQRSGMASLEPAPSPPGGDTSPHAGKRVLCIERVFVAEAAGLIFEPILGKGDPASAILERPRHQQLIAEVAATGARIRTLEEGDFASSVMAALPGTGIDAAIGIGDLHATLIAACAVRCLGGEFLARLLPRNDEEKAVLGDAASHVYSLAELAPAADIAVAISGVTGGPLLPGLSFGSGYAETASLVMSSRHATVRRLTTHHHLAGGGS